MIHTKAPTQIMFAASQRPPMTTPHEMLHSSPQLPKVADPQMAAIEAELMQMEEGIACEEEVVTTEEIMENVEVSTTEICSPPKSISHPEPPSKEEVVVNHNNGKSYSGDADFTNIAAYTVAHHSVSGSEDPNKFDNSAILNSFSHASDISDKLCSMPSVGITKSQNFDPPEDIFETALRNSGILIGKSVNFCVYV